MADMSQGNAEATRVEADTAQALSSKAAAQAAAQTSAPAQPHLGGTTTPQQPHLGGTTTSQQPNQGDAAGPVRPPVRKHGSHNLPQRYFFLLVGILINAFAIELITRSALGTSPISSLPYVLSLEERMFTFGETTIFINACFVLIEIALLRREFQPVQLLQFGVAFALGEFIDLSSQILSAFNPTWLPLQIATAVVGSLLLAFGISIEIAPHVITAPGEGAVRAIAHVTKIKFGTVKIAFDLSLCAAALVLSFIFWGQVQGLGLATIISAILTGRGINFFNEHLKPLEHIRALDTGVES